MASVHLNWVQPQLPDLVKLHIYESSTKDGIYTPFEEVTAIGTYPDYISEYTTDDAASVTGWFAIQWEDSKGAKTDISAPRQGGADMLPAVILSRVLLRDSAIKEGVALQEAEAIIQWYFQGVDPYSIIPSTVSYTKLSGLTLLTMARSYLAQSLAQSDTESFTAGLVSMKSGTQRDLKNLVDLIGQANIMLGLNIGVVAQMEAIEIAGGASLVAADLSRLILEIE